jgi:hypothetical protein
MLRHLFTNNSFVVCPTVTPFILNAGASVPLLELPGNFSTINCKGSSGKGVLTNEELMRNL